MDSSLKTCANCHKSQADLSQPLKRCANCQDQWYCSRDCQKADWKAHKPLCASSQHSNTHTKPHATTNPDAEPKSSLDSFKDIGADDYLHRFSEKDTFRQLVDCYRMRVEDDYFYAGDTRGLYNEDDPLPDFQDFLDQAEAKGGILPSWWSGAKREECEAIAVDTEEWSDLYAAVEKHDIVEHYGDRFMPMKLRVLAEKIYGCPIGET